MCTERLPVPGYAGHFKMVTTFDLGLVYRRFIPAARVANPDPDSAVLDESDIY